MIYIPKGEMCIVCERVLENCSALPFKDYIKAGKPDDEGYIEVICREFRKGKVKLRRK